MGTSYAQSQKLEYEKASIRIILMECRNRIMEDSSDLVDDEHNTGGASGFQWDD